MMTYTTIQYMLRSVLLLFGLSIFITPVSADHGHMMGMYDDMHERMMRQRHMQSGMGMMHGGGMMGGMHHGMGMMHGRAMMVYMLDLDDKQRKKIRALQQEQRKANWQRRGSMIDLQYELQDLYDKDKPDAKAIGKVYDKIFALKKQMIESHITTRNKMRDVLNKEQQEKFDNMRGGMGMMGPHLMGGGMMH